MLVCSPVSSKSNVDHRFKHNREFYPYLKGSSQRSGTGEVCVGEIALDCDLKIFLPLMLQNAEGSSECTGK